MNTNNRSGTTSESTSHSIVLAARHADNVRQGTAELRREAYEIIVCPNVQTAVDVLKSALVSLLVIEHDFDGSDALIVINTMTASAGLDSIPVLFLLPPKPYNALPSWILKFPGGLRAMWCFLNMPCQEGEMRAFVKHILQPVI